MYIKPVCNPVLEHLCMFFLWVSGLPPDTMVSFEGLKQQYYVQYIQYF